MNMSWLDAIACYASRKSYIYDNRDRLHEESSMGVKEKLWNLCCLG